MRVLVSSFASTSHLFPMVPLCWALRAAGHEVRVGCGPALVDDVVDAGLTPSVVDDRVDTAAIWAGAPNRWGRDEPGDREAERARRAMEMFTAAAAGSADELLDLARRWRADLVLFEPRAYAGPLVAAALKVPAVRHLYGVDYTYGRLAPERPALDRLWSGRLAPAPDPHGTLTVDPCPAPLQVPSAPARLVMRYVPYNGPALIPDRGDRRRRTGVPRVCVTWGTTVAGYRGDLSPAATALAAVAAAGADVVVAVATGHRDQLGPMPAGVEVVEGLALHLLLPGVDAVVHQGGAGTTMTAAACGVPQLVVPGLADRFLNAERVARCGAGLAVVQAEADEEALRRAVARLLAEPSFRLAAAELQAEGARQATPAQIVPTLAEVARSGTPVSGPRVGFPSAEGGVPCV